MKCGRHPIETSGGTPLAQPTAGRRRHFSSKLPVTLKRPHGIWSEFTPRDHWIGGFKKDGEPFTTLDGLRERLAGHFRMIGEASDIPFVIRETQRKFQHSGAEITAWERVE